VQWNSIWKLNVLPKLENLIWRVCRDCFPTRVRLNNKGVACHSKCVMCIEADEDSLHAFFTCPRASQVWQAANLKKLLSTLRDYFNVKDYFD